MVCRDFILPEPASYVFFYALFNLRKLLYIIAKLKKERLLRSEEDHTIQRTQDLLDHLRSGPDTLSFFDEALFSELVEKIIVTDNETLRFRLINGLELTETIERTKR